MNFTEVDAAMRLGIAALAGLGVGLEREWSGHTTGPDARFAGIRTFLLLGIIGGIGGLFFSAAVPMAGLVSVGGGVALAVGAYVTAARRPDSEIDGTTETAALVVVLLGTMAGFGWLSLTAGVGSIVVLVLLEKSRLHSAVRALDERELQGALQFAVMALVILPLLPAGPYGSTIVIEPRMLWTLVLVLSGLNFVGYVARRALGHHAGYAVAGLIGGLISSTAVTLDFSHKSRQPEALHSALAQGVIAACTILIPRVLVVSTVLNAEVGLQLVFLLAAPFAAGCLMLYMAKREFNRKDDVTTHPPGNPLRPVAAIQMAILFQLSMSVLSLINKAWGTAGVYSAAAVLGLADMDALTLSMSRLDRGVPASTAALAIAVGLLVNTLLKAFVTVIVGRGAFRVHAAVRLSLQAAASLIAIGGYATFANLL